MKFFLLYNFFTSLSALKSGYFHLANILLAVVFPDAREPVIPIFFILVLILIIQLIFDLSQDLFYSTNRRLFVLGR